MTVSRNLAPKIGLAFVGAFFIMCWIVIGNRDSVEGGAVEIFGVAGVLLILITIIATFANVLVAARRAHLSGSWFWFLAVIFVWPLSYVYTLVVNRGECGECGG